MRYFTSDFGATDISETYVASPEVKSPGQTFNPEDPSTLFNTLTNVAGSSMNRTLDTAGKFASSREVQELLKSHGLDVYVKDVNREAIKTILSWVGVMTTGFYAKKVITNKYALGGIAIGLAYFYFGGKDRNVKLG